MTRSTVVREHAEMGLGYKLFALYYKTAAGEFDNTLRFCAAIARSAEAVPYPRDPAGARLWLARRMRELRGHIKYRRRQERIA
ncbi:MAG: hypothetical protein KAV00_07090 [Phycisphaerae bacterium]|nr:hypothetical protein [Phycisphaerae bacterium]